MLCQQLAGQDEAHNVKDVAQQDSAEAAAGVVRLSNGSAGWWRSCRIKMETSMLFVA